MSFEKLSIIIPAYNEEDTIETVIKQLIHYTNGMNTEIIVVNDGSSDNTSNLVKKFETVKLLEHQNNRGKGSALKTGFLEASGDFILIQDADMEYHPKDIPKLIKPIKNSKVDVVYGSRFKGEGINTMSFSHRFGNWLLTKATRFLYRVNITDMETGYKLFRKKLISNVNLKANSFNIEPELTAIFAKKDVIIEEVPISYQYREKGEAKISWIDGVIGLWWLIKLRFKRL